jgi:protocatechuate 3,4-dioxygenase beta subunit
MNRAALLLAGALVMVNPVGAQPRCTPTKPDALGPFYTPNAPERSRTGQGLVVAGTVRSTSNCQPVPGAQLEWWSANPRGDYDDQHRATQRADAEGRYRYETDAPGRYPGRPPHLHLRITAPGHRLLVTQLYPRPDQTSLEVDLVLTAE